MCCGKEGTEAMSKQGDTFTLKELREAYNRAVRGLPLTEKQKILAKARRAAVCALTPYNWNQEELRL